MRFLRFYLPKQAEIMMEVRNFCFGVGLTKVTLLPQMHPNP